MRAAVESEGPSLVWDIGCNEGAHSRIAAETADYVVAMDADPLVADRLYRALREEEAGQDPAAVAEHRRPAARTRVARCRAAAAAASAAGPT